MYALCLWIDRRPAVQRDRAGHEGLEQLLAGQRRRHIVAQYMTARRWARALEQAVLHGVSPSGYGPPLTPLASDRAQSLLEPVTMIVKHFRAFAAEQAPAELAATEAPRSERHTVLWARNLLEHLADAVEGLAAELEQDAEADRLAEQARHLSDEVGLLVEQARCHLKALDDR